MNYNLVKFQGAYGTSAQIPESIRPEVSFVGRSNVGKSSLINRLFNRKKLAKVSSMPGKTSTINFFTTDKIDFVDLPGYGYAKVAKSEKARWSEMINGYFDQYRYYALVVSLIDIRHPATKLDEQMIEFLRACELPFIIALTKADKLSLVSPTAFLLLYVLQPTEQALMNCEGLLRMPANSIDHWCISWRTSRQPNRHTS